MNSLSWMFYYADMVSSLGIFCNVIGALLAVVCGSAFIVAVIQLDTYSCDEDDKLSSRKVRNTSLKLLVLPALLFLVGCVIPSKQTIYMIIASETGETAVKSETGKKLVSAVNRYLDSISEEDKKHD